MESQSEHDFIVKLLTIFIRLSRNRPYYMIGYGGQAGGRPHRFPHNNFSSVYRIFTKLGHMIPLWKGKPLFILGSKVKVTVTINIIVYRLIIYIDGHIL
jgi:hypothetical protein